MRRVAASWCSSAASWIARSCSPDFSAASHERRGLYRTRAHCAQAMSAKSARLVAAATAAIEDFPVAMAWAPDGTALAVGGGEGRLYLVSADGSATRQFGEHAPGVLELAWQPRGAQL